MFNLLSYFKRIDLLFLCLFAIIEAVEAAKDPAVVNADQIDNLAHEMNPDSSDASKNLKPPKNASWNFFRYIADFIHLGGIVILIYWLFTRKSLAGLSWKTQVLFLLMYVSRYLDLFFGAGTHVLYLIIFKLTFISSSALILYLFKLYDRSGTYEEDKDTVSLACIIAPCFIASIILTSKSEPGSSNNDLVEILWTFSEYLEGFSMVPQYVFCYRENAQTQHRGPIMFIMCLGVYRVFYAFNWIYKLSVNPRYSDFQSWLGGFIEIAFFFDFLSFQYRQRSVLRSLVLVVDDKVNETVEKMELVVLPSRKDAIEERKTHLTEMRQRRVLGTTYDMVKMEEQL